VRFDTRTRFSGALGHDMELLVYGHAREMLRHHLQLLWG
jgi:esterase/lipase superfamily enzyme